MSEASVVASTFAFALASVVVTVLLFVWGRWVARRQGGGVWARLAWAPWLGFAAQVVGTGLTIVLLFHGFGAVADVAPERKAQALADSISTAMLPSAAGALVAVVAYATALVACVVGTIREPG